MNYGSAHRQNDCLAGGLGGFMGVAVINERQSVQYQAHYNSVRVTV